MRPRPLLPLLALLAATGLPAVAQTGSPAAAGTAPQGREAIDGEDPEGAGSVAAQVTVVGSRLAIADPGSTVRVVTRKEIEQIPARSLPELLRALPGLDVRRRGVEGIQADIGIRGADYNGTLLLVDGEPVNDPQSNHLTSDVDVPLDAIERVEVLYGAGASLYGSNAVGGVVNIVTRGANLGNARGSWEGRIAHGTDSLDAGSWRFAALPASRLGVAVDLSRSESSGFRDDTEHSAKTVRVSSRLETDRGPVTLTLGYASREFGAYAFYGTRYPDQQETTLTRTARLAGELTFGGWTIAPSLAIRAHHDDYVLDRSNPSFYENRHDSDLSAARLFGRRALLGGTLAVGLEAGREAIRSTNLGARSRDHGALFVELGRPFDLGRPGAGSFRIGLRADAYDGFGSRLSPHASLSYTPTFGIRLRASIGTAFRVPTFTDLYYSDPQSAGNADLRAETAVNVEAGGSVDVGPVTLDAVVFNRQGRDLIDYVRNAPTERFQARNVRRADTTGIEAVVELRPDRVRLGPLQRLALQATYSFVDLAALSAAADGATEGRYVLDPLHTKWDLIAGGALPFGVRATTRLSYLSRPSFADGVWLWEARLGRPFLVGDVFEVYVEGENLGNVTYQERPGVPLPGRTLLGGLRFAW